MSDIPAVNALIEYLQEVKALEAARRTLELELERERAKTAKLERENAALRGQIADLESEAGE